MELLVRFLKLELAAATWLRRKMVQRQPPPFRLRYSCTEEMVLFNTTAKPALITASAFPEMKAGNCFANAMQLALEHRELRYTEGWACMEQSVPTHHAWVTHPDGSVSDPTWLSIVNSMTESDLIPGYRARCVYMGISIPLANHLAWFREHGTPNLLAFGEMMPRKALTDGMDAYAEALEPGEVDRAAVLAMAAIRDASQWELDDDGQFYERVLADGTVERWSGGKYYTG
jgi:hypothetical protein